MENMNFEHLPSEESTENIAANIPLEGTLNSLATSELYSKDQLLEDLRRQIGVVNAKIAKLEQYAHVKQELNKLYSDTGVTKTNIPGSEMAPQYEQIIESLEKEIEIPTSDLMFVKAEIAKQKTILEELEKVSKTTEKNYNVDSSLN
jgi:hypothetical protein